MTEKGIKIIRIVAIILAAVTLLGLLVSLVPQKTDLSGVGNNAPTNVATEGLRASDYALLYVQEGLVASYIGDASTLTEATLVENGVQKKVYEWRNFVSGGQAAILTMPNKWRATQGGIGYTMTHHEWATLDISCEIPYDLSYNSMPNYEVELVCSMTGLTNADGTPYVTSSEDYLYGLYNERKSTFRFGLVHSFSSVTQQDGSGNLFNRWYVSNQSYKVHGSETASPFCAGLMSNGSNSERVILNNGFLGKPITLSVSRNVSSLVAEYDLRYFSGSAEIYASSYDVDKEYHEANWSTAYKDDAEPFSVLNDYPGTIYALRLYERTLTTEEKNQNFFVDACRYYSINVSKFTRMDSETFAFFAHNCAIALMRNGVDMTEADYAADRAMLLQIISENWED